MENQTTPCKALVLAGGGARGSYQVGVWKALMELDWHPQIITGTSVGSLNGAMFVLDLYEVARDMWLTIRSKDVMELPEENADLSALHSFLRSVVKAGGMDVSPLEEIVERVLDEDALRRANIRFGLVTVEQRGLKPRELALDEIPQGRVKDYLMASAACFPALRAREIDGVKFLDGGYSDNMPTGLAKKMGADELVCVDLEGVGITRPNLTGLPTTMVRSYWELGDILHFAPDTARRNVELGYYDTLRAFGRVRGCAYVVDNGPDSSADAAAFRARIDAVQQAVREMFIGSFKKKGTLSLRQLVRAKGGRCVFIEYDLGIGSMLAPIYSLMFDLAIKEALCRKKSAGSVYFITDEFSLLPNLRHVDDAVNFGRSLGIKFLIGYQNIEQIADIYGEARAHSLLSGFLTGIFFRCNDAGSVRYIKEFFGQNRKKEVFMSAVQGRGISEQIRDAYVVEDWDISRLGLGDAIVGLPGAEPFRFHFARA